MNKKNIFFNSSMPRSGSTLIQNILGQNPVIHVTPTDGSLELLYAARMNFTSSPEFKAQDSELMLKAWRQFCFGGLQGYCNGLTDKPNVCIKSRGIGIHFDWFNNFMEEKPKIICMIRNMKSILSSVEKLYRNNPDYHSNMINFSQLMGTTREKRVDLWLGSNPKEVIPLVGLALERFYEMENLGIDKHVLYVKLEDLSQNPKKELNRIYKYLELPYYEHDFNNIEQITVEDDSFYGLSPNLHKINKKIMPSIPDYYDILGKNICQHIDNNGLTNWYQRKFGYYK